MGLPDRLDAIKQPLHAFLPCEILRPPPPLPAKLLVAASWATTYLIHVLIARGRAVDGLLNLTRKAVVTQFGHDRCSQPRGPALSLFGGDFQ